MAKKPKNSGVYLKHDQADIFLTRRFVKVSHHRHTAKHLPREYTSYAILFFVLAFGFLSLFFVRQQIVSAGPPQSQNGSIQLSGIVPGPPPSDPAMITAPANSQRFSQSEVDISGDCTAGLIVEVYRNDGFVGSQICGGSGGFNVTTTLLPGENIIKARIKDGIGQYGPDSTLISLYYDVPTIEELVVDDEIQPRLTVEEATEIREERLNDPLTITTQPIFAGFFSKQKSKLVYEIKGGVAPYAVVINWGDGSKDDLQSKTEPGEHSATHVYKSGGQYEITITMIDQLGSKAVIQTIMVVSGDKEKVEQIISTSCNVNPSHPNCPLSNQMLEYIDQAVPALAGATLLGSSFWLGEHVVYTRLGSAGRIRIPRKLFK